MIEVVAAPWRQLVATSDGVALRLLPLDATALPVARRDVPDAEVVDTLNLLYAAAASGTAGAKLKPGGHYGILDHTRRHNEPDNTENWRRVDPVQAIKEVQAAGFALEDFSRLHYTPDDELRYEVGRKNVTGNSDRFVLRFRKP